MDKISSWALQQRSCRSNSAHSLTIKVKFTCPGHSAFSINFQLIQDGRTSSHLTFTNLMPLEPKCKVHSQNLSFYKNKNGKIIWKKNKIKKNKNKLLSRKNSSPRGKIVRESMNKQLRLLYHRLSSNSPTSDVYPILKHYQQFSLKKQATVSYVSS